tara:strand:+ start:953 stop:1450 length:498 start_codon:yes stop_codon:yes gene_type:complete
MALIIEDGTGVDNANSYITVAEARSYADLRSLLLPSGDSAVEVLIVKAFDYLESLEYKGSHANPPQAAEFPRQKLYLQGVLFPDNQIPYKLKQAQCQLAFEAVNIDLQPTGNGKEVIREKVDVVEVQYSEKGINVARPTFTTVNSLLKDLVKSGLSSGYLTSTRV